MQTEPMFAYQIEDEDFLLVDNQVVQVTTAEDAGDTFNFDARDDNGDNVELPVYGPFDVLAVVVDFSD